MRTLIRGTLLIIVAGLFGGCGSSTVAKPDAPAATHVDQVAENNTCVMQSGGSDVLRLTMPADTKCTAKDGWLFIKSPDYELNVWLVDGVQTVDEGVGRIDTQIVSKFKDFKPDQTTDLTIAGAPAKRLAGRGHEADDGDDGEADVIVFKVGDHVFIACIDDEHLIPPARQGMLTVVQTAHKP